MKHKTKLTLILFLNGLLGFACNKTYQTGIIKKDIFNSAQVEYSTSSSNQVKKFSNLIRFLQIGSSEGDYFALIKPYGEKRIEALELKENYKIRFVTDDPDRAGQEFSTNKFGIIYADQIEILDKK